MKDLTKGKPSALILSFALPIFLGNLLQLTYSLADTRIVGSFLGEQSLAAVGATTTISNLIVGFLLGIGGVVIPWNTLMLSTVLFVVIPLLAGVLTRNTVIKNKITQSRIYWLLNKLSTGVIFSIAF